MTQWALIVEQNAGFGRERMYWSPEVLAEVQGTREEALARLREHAEGYRPKHPRSVRRRTLYALGDGFLLVAKGVTRTFHCRFSLGELVQDSDRD